MPSSLEKFPVRYDVHKYLGRKPWYIVYNLIARFSKRGNTVLDLFSGSGVASFEALRLDRNVIAVDYSSLSELIVKTLCSYHNISEFDRALQSLTKKLKSIEHVYYVNSIQGEGLLEYWIPDQHKGKLIIGNTEKIINNISETDFTHSEEVKDFKWKHERTQIPKIPCSNVSTWGEIFSNRAQYVLHNALGYIKSISDSNIRNALLVALSASLEKIALLNHFKSIGEGWIREKPICYYKPQDYIEFNAIKALENKAAKMRMAIIETNNLLEKSHGSFSFIREHAENLNYKTKFDLIIMDPPYLSEVPYDKLEALHDIWLGFKPENQNIHKAFDQIALKSYNALSDRGILVLLLLNYQKESREFFVNKLANNGFVKLKETRNYLGSKEGLSISVFKKSN
ncbi:MAG: DNA methyltransferase [Candidatus Micrarchaeia archaeon]